MVLHFSRQRLKLKEKRAEFEACEHAQHGETDLAWMTLNQSAANAGQREDIWYPASAALCFKCNVKAVVLLDGPNTCLAFGFSKCG